MAAREWLSLAVGGTLAAVGLAAWLTAARLTPPGPAPSTVVVESVAADPAPQGTGLAEELTGLPPSVSTVLQAHGHLEVMGAMDLSGALSESITRVLISDGAMLNVEDGSS